MFPFDKENEDELKVEEVKIPKEYGINFETGQLTGKVVEGLEAIRVWAWFALKSERYNFQQYTWNYGCEIESLIGKSYSEELIKSEIKRMITECLTVNKHITGITNFECSVVDDSVSASFSIITDYGEVETSV